jgi:glucuronokinase
MKRIETAAYARAGLVGNPSDGYFGKTISFTIRDFAARVVIYSWPTLEILPSPQDHVQFGSLAELAQDVRLNGYYGGLRLVKAALKKFHDYCEKNGIELPAENFSLRYQTDIPRQVGMAGSSAICMATFRALMRFYDVEIPPHLLASWVLATEVEELKIAAGLQDRVCQAYEGLVYMDFNREKLQRDGYGTYEPLDPRLLPPLYLAYKTKLAEISGIVHSNLRQRWEAGEPEVVDAMKQFAALAERARECLLAGRKEELGEIMDANFNLRRKIIHIGEDHLEMVETARKCGASAKFAGSGGAIVGTYPNEKVFEALVEKLGRLGCEVIKPRICN